VATADTEAPSKPNLSRLRRGWEKMATVLAVIGLIDVSSQLIHWAKLIHEIAEKYAAARTWLFSWLPFHIPLELHDPIVLLLILFSVTNIGLYQGTGRSYLVFIWALVVLVVLWPIKPFYTRADLEYRRIIGEWQPYHKVYDLDGLVPIPYMALCAVFAVFTWLFYYASAIDVLSSHYTIATAVIIVIIIYTVILSFMWCVMIMGIIIYSLVVGAEIAWRWVLTTLAIFGALVFVNQVYVTLLEPLAEH
jgi:hypothetical protein